MPVLFIDPRIILVLEQSRLYGKGINIANKRKVFMPLTRSIVRLGAGLAACVRGEMDSRRFAPCGCHFVGEKVVQPRSSAGLENWFKRWKSCRKHCTVPNHMDLWPDDNTGVPRDGAVTQFWDFIHAPSVDARPPKKFVGVKKMRRIGPKVKFTRKAVLRRLQIRQQYPTSSIDSIAVRHGGRYD